MAERKKTPLHDAYVGLPGVRFVDFGGWELPVWFSSIQEEHRAVRERCGLFDVSHMGEFIVSGANAAAFLQKLTTNDITKLSDGQAQYTLMCAPDGGTIDDLLVYRLSADRFLAVVNASNIEKDGAWMQEHLDGAGDVRLENASDDFALLALQGPLAASVLAAAGADRSVVALPPFRFASGVSVAGTAALVSRTGYTGEDGFELYVPAAGAAAVWEALLSAGAPFGLAPAGLGARDTLRFEARLPLYGQELSPSITPLEAGLGAFVALDKGDFVGRGALAKQKAAGVPRKLVGLELIEPGIPRAGCAVYADGVCIGAVTSGTRPPTAERSLGLALLDAACAGLGAELQVDIRGRRARATVVKTPFYKRSAKE